MKEKNQLANKHYNLIRVILWFIGFCFIFSNVQTLLMVKKHSVLTMDDFYSLEEDSLDIVLLGSSHVVNGIDSQIIENIVGKKTFSCAIIGQTAPIHVNYLKEVLKFQHPKMLIIDIYRFRMQEYKNPPLSDLHESVDGMRFSPVKFDCIYKNTAYKNIPEYIFPLIRYHSRWKELDKTDFKYLMGIRDSSNKGFFTRAKKEPQKVVSYNNSTELPTLPKKTEELLNEIVSIAAFNKIDLLFVNLPYAHINSDDNAMFSAITIYLNKLCKAYNVRFDYVDYNYKLDNLVVDYDTDFMDISHLNENGARKISRHLAEYINANYILRRAISK